MKNGAEMNEADEKIRMDSAHAGHTTQICPPFPIPVLPDVNIHVVSFPFPVPVRA